MILSYGIEFFDIGGDPRELMAYMVRNSGLLPSCRAFTRGEIRRKREIVRGIMERCWLSCFESLRPGTKPFVADAIIANPPSFAHIHCAQKLGIPVHMVFTYSRFPRSAGGELLADVAQHAMVTNKILPPPSRQCTI